MGFPTRACMELTSDDAMKQSLRLVKDVSLSMSWNAESLPVGRACGDRRQDSAAQASFKKKKKVTTSHSDVEISAILYLIFIAALGNHNY